MLSRVAGRLSGRNLLATCWLVGVVGAAAVGMGFVKSPGSPGRVQREWPTTVPHAAGEPALVLFAHPKCPCTAAALDELGEVARLGPPAVRVSVYFVCPPGTPDGWECGRNWERAHGIGASRVERDYDGRHARAFGVHTSGHVLLFTADGVLRFSGGLSGSRVNLSDLLGRDGPPVRTAVFGCPLFASDNAPEGRP